jgi:ATP-dependent DNA helicase RecQ
MEFLARALDDPNAAPCGKCMNCTHHTERRTVPAALAQAATTFLRGDSLVIEPRRWWPKPLLGEIKAHLPSALDRYEDSDRAKIAIPERLRAKPGCVLCIYGDAGWGEEVARCKYQTGVFSDALVDAAAALIREKWKPQPWPEWITAAPSRSRPTLVADFARRLAERLRVPFAAVIQKRRENQPQKNMRNSVQQLRNLLDAFEVAGQEPEGALQAVAWNAARLLGRVTPIPSGPVLLVDDMVDSGWTLTLLAVLLRLRGSGPVHPFALAKASPRGS